MNKKTTTPKKKAAAKVRQFESALKSGDTRTFVFRLFISGLTPRSREAIENVRALCEEHLKGRYQLEIVDVYQHPLSAKENQVIAAPTLMKKLPLPVRKVVGDMSKYEKVLHGLDIKITTSKKDKPRS